MAFDGFGTFIRLRSWIADATAGVKIRADFHDDEDNNLAAGLTNCICKDGQSTITQNIPFNSKRITALADPIDPQDAATKHYADNPGDLTITNADPSFTLNGTDGFKNSIYGDKGGKHRWEIVLGNATAESGSDVGSDFELVNYHDDGTRIGDVFFGTRSTGLMTVKADPADALGVATKQYVDARHANLQVFTTTSDFTVPAGITRVYAKCVGAGGGGGSTRDTPLYGGAGGGGGLTEGYVDVTPAQIIHVTVGAAGLAGNTGPGGVGGTSSFGAFMSATGGTGGHGQGDANMQGGVSGQGTGGQINAGLGDGSCGYAMLAAGQNNSPGSGGGPGGQNGTGSGGAGFPGRGPGGGGGGSGNGQIGSVGGYGYRGEVYVWW